MKRIGLLCKKEHYNQLHQSLKVGPWKLFHIQTAPIAWQSIVSRSLDGFVFYFDELNLKHYELISKIKSNYKDIALIVISHRVEISENMDWDQFEHFALFDLEKDKEDIVSSLIKFLSGEEIIFRKEKRYRAYPFVNVKSLNLQSAVKSRLLNLSSSGAELQGELGILMLGDELKIQILSSEGKSKDISAIIRWKKKLNENDGLRSDVCRLGLEFL